MPLSQIQKDTLELIATLNTTSGASQTASGLDLTKYKKLCIVTDCTFSIGGAFTINGLVVGNTVSLGNPHRGHINIDLVAGTFEAFIMNFNAANSSTAGAGFSGKCGYTNATVSMVFAIAGGNFTGGTISIYGVR